jgi:outer membrane protein
LQKKYFGNDGELAKKRQELIKPIQDNVYNALKSVATEAGYDYIFDKVTGDIIYASEKYDESDVVLKKIIK